jgi:hypothetical protein
MPLLHQCPYCSTFKPTEQGVRSHIAQSPGCFSRQKEESERVLDEESASEVMDIQDEDEDDAPFMDADPPLRLPSVESDAETEANAAQPQHHRLGVEMEEVFDEEEEGLRWVEDFPTAAGETKGRCESAFYKHRKAQQAARDAPWAPFESQKEWELARWLMTSGVSRKKMDSFLKLESVRIFKLLENKDLPNLYRLKVMRTRISIIHGL